MKNEQNFYQNLLQTKNLFITLSHSEHIVTKFELIDNKLRFYCDKFVTSFDEKFVKIKF